MPLSKRLIWGLVGTFCALGLAAEASAAQNRFDSQNDVPGAAIVDPDKQKINPDTIPEFPATGDTSVRPHFYMSPGSGCTELEDPLPGGCEANALRKDSRLREPVEGPILAFPLVLPPLPPVALAPLPKVIVAHLPPFVAHPVLPPALAVPMIRPVSTLPSIHLVFPAVRTSPVALPHIEIPQTDPIKVSPHDRVFLAKPKIPSAAHGLDVHIGASLPTYSHMSVRPVQVSVPRFGFIKLAHGVFPSAHSVPSVNSQIFRYSVDLTRHGISRPMHAPSVINSELDQSHGAAAQAHEMIYNAHTSLAIKHLQDNAHTPRVSVGATTSHSSVIPNTVVKSLVTRSTIVIGSSPHAHSTTLTHPTAYVLH